MFHRLDFDNTMLRIGSMNMLLHSVESPAIRYRDFLAQDHAGEDEKFTLVLANRHFAGLLDYQNCAKDLLRVVKTKKTELLFLALFLRLRPSMYRRSRYSRSWNGRSRRGCGSWMECCRKPPLAELKPLAERTGRGRPVASRHLQCRHPPPSAFQCKSIDAIEEEVSR